MSKKANLFIIILIGLVLGGALVFSLRQHSFGMACTNKKTQLFTITISNDKPSASHITGKLCDRLQFINQDKVLREIAFGSHNNHVPYDGVTEEFLNRNQSFTITFDAVGTFHWHDHLHDEVQGYFTVSG